MTEHGDVLEAYQTHQKELRRRCFCSGARPQDVDDIVQETIAVVLDGYRHKGVRSIEGWMYGVLKKQISMYHRNRRRLDSRFVPLGLDPEGALRLPLVESGERRVVIRVDVRRALLSLSPRPRAVMVLSGRGHAPGDVARRAGISTVSVRKTRRRAIERMRRHLTPPPG